MVKSINLYNVSKKSSESSTYIKKRYKELIKKGFTPEQAKDMIHFEIGMSTVMREGMEAATAEECMLVGRLIGTELGGTIGSLTGTPVGMGTGSFVGGLTGSFFSKAACNKIIKIASEKAVQTTSEQLVKAGNDLNDAEINVKYISDYIADSSQKTKEISDFVPSKAIKDDSSKNTVLLKGRVSENVHFDKQNNLSGNNLADNSNVSEDTASYIKNGSLLQKSIYDATNEDPYEKKARILGELKEPQNNKVLKVHELIQNNDNVQSEVEFDEDKDYSSYVNEVTNSNNIFTTEDLDNMSDSEYEENKEAIDFQKKSIGIPSSKQAEASGMVFVSGYTRSDGIEVKSYYRARPA